MSRIYGLSAAVRFRFGFETVAKSVSFVKCQTWVTFSAFCHFGFPSVSLSTCKQLTFWGSQSKQSSPGFPFFQHKPKPCAETKLFFSLFWRLFFSRGWISSLFLGAFFVLIGIDSTGRKAVLIWRKRRSGLEEREKLRRPSESELLGKGFIAVILCEEGASRCFFSLRA